MKLWGGRFNKATDKKVDDFNSSISFDARLYKQDITGSILALISLGLVCGAQATLQISGPDEENAIREIGDLFEYEFDFPPR